MNSLEKLVTLYGQISDLAYDKSLFEAGVNEVEISGEKYEIIDWYDANKVFPSNGFQAILLKSNEGYTLAFRGTEPFDKMGVDIFNDLLMPIYSPQMATALIWTSQIIDKYQIDKSNLTLTGHSLGGILTQYVGSELGIKGYAYNPWGINTFFTSAGNTINYIIDRILGNIGINNKDFAKNNIYNVSYQDEGNINGDALSNALTGIISEHIGSFIPIFGKNLGLDAHFIAPLNHAISEYNSILKHFNSNVTYKELTKVYLATAIVHQGKGYETLQSEFKKIGVFESKDDSLNLDIITTTLNLQNAFSPTHITTPALYALVHLNPFIVSGVDSPAYKELEKYKDEYSDNYIQDRIKMFDHFMHNVTDVGSYFYDMQSGVSHGITDGSNHGTSDNTNPYIHEITNQFIFGTNQNDVIKDAVALLDDNVKTRVYSLAGDDNIKIVGGSAYIEAGSGNDTIDLRSSKGENTVYGGVNNGKNNDDDGDDTIYAGQGKDTIYGGNGKDTIYTDNDDKEDLLYGGDGFDTYYVGDKDVIFDSDGKGKVVFDGVELKGGTYDKDKGAYVSKDGLIEYRLNESGGKSTLTVQKGGKSITINEFSKEDKSLGITLLDANEIGISISDNQTNEGDSGKKSLDFNISLQGSIEKGEFLILGVGDKEYLFGDPSEEYIKKYNLNLAKYERGNIYTYTWDGNTIKQEDREFEITPRIIQTSDKLKAKILKSGTGKIIDDDDDPDSPNDTFPDTTPASTKTSPIVIDLNGDGVKTISRKNGKTYFDLDNNKFAENTSWIDKNDGILINKTLIANSVTNGSKLFGNHTLLRDGSLADNGFEALKEFVNLNLLVA